VRACFEPHVRPFCTAARRCGRVPFGLNGERRVRHSSRCHARVKVRSPACRKLAAVHTDNVTTHRDASSSRNAHDYLLCTGQHFKHNPVSSELQFETVVSPLSAPLCHGRGMMKLIPSAELQSLHRTGPSRRPWRRSVSRGSKKRSGALRHRALRPGVPDKQHMLNSPEEFATEDGVLAAVLSMVMCCGHVRQPAGSLRQRAHHAAMKT